MSIDKKPVAIILGGTNPHKSLVEKLKERGYFTILLDYLDNPPAKAVADEHVQESTLDKEKVLEVAKEKNASLVIATCIDQANVTACWVAEKIELPHPYSYETASLIADKTRMKQKMIKAGIPTAKFCIVNNEDNIDLEMLTFPLVVKPSDTNGSKGVRRVDNSEELDIYLKEALSLSRNGKAIVEEFIEGDEIGIDCFIAKGKADVITTHKKRKPQLKDGSVIFSIGSISPAPITEIVKAKIEAVANQLATVFSLDNTPLLIQAIVTNDEVKVIEFAPRIGGGLNFRKIKLFADFDIISAAVDSFLNIPVKIEYQKKDVCYSENHIYTEPGIFGSIEGYDKLLNSRNILEFYPNKVKGMIIGNTNASKDRIGSYIVSGKSLAEIKRKITTTMSEIIVYDINGRNMKYSYDYKDLLF
ncbi:ATP-grasp domain-containing protein [Pleomorphovibrio marinus]|uniref:ATP-grasp domain-containing protein n=1 Tax=Pleomorphovibrio marinus TaxID=2164132 RepID=UPI000E0C3BE6|nr:ATP-grasp domain-containing protein [Pleomorphovibrio marinus]